MSNQLTMLGTRDNHYDNMVRMYSNCSVVLDNLEVTYTLEHHDLSFLQVCPACCFLLFPGGSWFHGYFRSQRRGCSS